MNQSLAIITLIILMVVTANVPFVSERLFGVVRLSKNNQPVEKPFWLRFIEVLVFYGIVVLIGFAFESQMGNRFSQSWQFYAITLSVFLTCAYPGFVWRYLRRRRKGRKAKP